MREVQGAAEELAHIDSSPRLLLRGVAKSYTAISAFGVASGPPVQVLRDITLRLLPGQIMALRGPNGSGKTTLLKIIAGLIRPDRGRVGIEAPVVGFSTGEERSLSWRLSALHNLEFFGVLQGMRGDAARREAVSLLQTLGLGDRMHERVQALSSGQKQRLLVARAFLGNPGLVLLDEPTGRMDEESVARVWALFSERAAAGATIVLATHSDEDAGRSHLIGSLHDGVLELTPGNTAQTPIQTGSLQMPPDLRRAAGVDVVGTLGRLGAFFRRDFAIARSYPVGLALQLSGILLSGPSLFFLGRLVGSHSHYLQAYGGRYFPFAVLGVAVLLLQSATLTSFASSLRESQLTGTLEAMLATRARLSTILTGSALWSMTFGMAQLLLLVVVSAALLGMRLHGAQYGLAVLILALVVLSSLGLGLAEAGVVLLVKRGTPLNTVFGMASNLLGGVLYPVAVLPTPLLWLSALLPITHSANALRFGLLAGRAQASLHETAILALLSALYLGVGVGVARVGFGISRQRGTLGQY